MKHGNWETTFKHLWGKIEKDIAALPKVAEDQIQITFPLDGQLLCDKEREPHYKGFLYVVRGTLKVGWAPESQVRIRLRAGGSRIRTLGPPAAG
jgi:hypothetical protein